MATCGHGLHRSSNVSGRMACLEFENWGPDHPFQN